MINESKGISNLIKENVDKIYQLYLDNSYSTHNYIFGNKNIIIKFNHLNNYYSNIQIDKQSNIIVSLGIPTNGKEKRVKENITHELTHVIEIIGLGNKEYPKYNKKSLIEFKGYPMSKAMEFISDVFYKTLDNEVNANVAQTYIYIISDGRCTKEEALTRLKDWETYKLYDNIKNINLDILVSKLSKEEIDTFNSILIENNVRTISSNNINTWLNYWFKIFKRKAETFLKNSKRILDEIESDWKIYEQYTSIEEYDKVIDYSKYIKKFDEYSNNHK